MIINGGSNLCYTNVTQGLPTTYNTILDQDIVSSSHDQTSSSMELHTNSFLYNLSLLKEKVHQVQSLATIFIYPNDNDHSQHLESTAIVMPTMTTLIQEIIATSSSLMFTCQQMALGASSTVNNDADHKFQDHHIKLVENPSFDQLSRDNSDVAQGFFSNNDGRPISSLLGSRVQEPSILSYANTNNNLDTRMLKETKTTTTTTTLAYHGDDYFNMQSTTSGANNNDQDHRKEFKEENNGGSPTRNYDVFEFDAADLLAKYTHYCQVCGKGFKRDANLRMHMRAHGDEYKSNEALINPKKKINNNNGLLLLHDNSIPKLPRKYSCPQEGCRWNKKHAKFQPLKSMICVKNHYKRSHCPKMYICNRCNRKQFSLLSDLRTHEKHCGDLKWQCSCGTTFSRKDKLMGHVALFVGHTPLISSSLK